MSKTRVPIGDYETRAARDLRKTGAEAYVECQHFAAACLAYAFDDGDGVDQEIHGGDLLQDYEGWMASTSALALFAHIEGGGIFVAHNARFEILVWRKLRERDPRWPELKPAQVVCTMSLARAMALPAALGDLAPALRLPFHKDMEGHKLMLKLCKPKPQRRKADKGRPIEWNEEPADLARQLVYCKHDVHVERAVYRKLPALDPVEREMWIADQDINDFGIHVDREAIGLCLDAVTEEQERLNRELFLITDGYVKTANSATALRAWLAAWDCPLADCRKDTIAATLERVDLPPNVRRAIEIRQECAKSSTGKLKAMLNGLCADGRIHGLLEYHGAATGRWAGRRVQPQNMIRTPETFGPDQAEDVFNWLRSGAMVNG